MQPSSHSFSGLRFLPFVLALGAAACSGGSSGGTTTPSADGGDETALGSDSTAPLDDSTTPPGDSTTPPGDSLTPPPTDSTPPPPVDAPPPGDSGVSPLPCVGKGSLATDLPHDIEGALEGDLVGIGCPGDADHLHLQIAVGSKRYDIAVPVYDSKGGAPIGVYVKDLPAGSAAPGWSTAGFSYTADLGVHSSDFTMLDKPGMLARLKAELSYAHVSLHGKSYTDGTGVHDVHYKDDRHDGIILLRGRGAGGTDHAVAVRYSSASF